jgi:hypothetical protein
MQILKNNISLTVLWLAALFFAFNPLVYAMAIETTPPEKTTKLIFIHHSCGENLLNDNDGGLGRALLKNRYFVSDTNYGWGPSNIGDRTDILNWHEWFSSSKTRKYMKALLQETDRHSSYKRDISDPGGNNKIIMFKSCFPNSNIQGNSSDSPKKGHGLTIANAKAIYNDLLSYFSKHPETLFIAFSAPPVQERTFSKNARAFNNWLVYEWLKTYKGSNVGVFDFYNILTGKNNHHRIINNKVEHVYQKGKNTLHYFQDGDDHPVPEGNKKATAQFVPLLNMFYNNWKQNISYTLPEKTILAGSVQAKAAKKKQPSKQDTSKNTPKNISGSKVADLEADCSKWVIFSDESNDTNIEFKCEKKRGENALKINYKISQLDGWGVCGLIYPSPVSWKTKKGISFNILAKSTLNKFNFIIYQGKSQNDLHHFEISITTNQKMVSKWQTINIPFNKLKHPAWEEIPNDHIDLDLIQGVAFGFNGTNKKINTIWIDEIKLY